MEIRSYQTTFTAKAPLSTKEVSRIIENNLTHPYYKKLPLKEPNIFQKISYKIKTFVQSIFK